MASRSFGLAAGLCLAMLAGCGPAASPPAVAACELTVGWDPWEPYQYQAADGTLRGLDVDVVALLARDAGCTLRFQRGNWLDLLRQLRDGSVHVLLAATAVPERRDYARFSAPYRSESFALYVRSDDLAVLGPHDLAGLAATGRRIGYTEGYYYGAGVERIASAPATRAQLLPAPVVETNYARLMDGSIDALLDDPFVATAVLRRKGWSGRIARHPQRLEAGEVCLMFSRRAVRQDVVRRFDAALQARQRDRTLAALLQRYQG